MDPIKPFTTLSVDYWTFGLPSDQEKSLRTQHEEVHRDTATECIGCGWKRWVGYLHKCLYCGRWFCPACAEAHFGKTLEEWRIEKRKESRLEGMVKRGAVKCPDCGGSGEVREMDFEGPAEVQCKCCKGAGVYYPTK